MKKNNAFRQVSKTIFKKSVETQNTKKNDVMIKTSVCAILTFASVVLTVMNIINKYYVMMYTTIVLAVVFGICALVMGITKHRKVPEIVMALTICGVFSYYAISGQNFGFAILWIALVPALSMLLLSFRIGVIASTYFLLFLPIIFYIKPLRDLLPMMHITLESGEIGCAYTSTFMIRFPVLYASGYIASLFLMAQKTYYTNKSQENALFDALTNLKNRRFYNETLEMLEKKPVTRDFTVISMDLNNLKYFNDKYGHLTGDQVIIAASNAISQVFGKHTEDIFRTGGDEFVVFMKDENNIANSLIEEMHKFEETTKIEDINLSLSYGIVKGIDFIDADINFLIAAAERNMYAYKDDYYKRNKIDRRRDFRTL